MTDDARLAELLDRYFDEAATAAETRALGDLLRADQAARRSFWRAAELQAQLRAAVQLAHAKAASGEEAAAPEFAPATPAVFPALWDSLPSAIDWRTHLGRFTVLALAITLAVWGGIYLLVRPAAVEPQVARVATPTPEPAPEGRIAFLRQYDGALWADGATSIPSQGRGYFAGTTLDLEEGLARFEFQDGAEIVIEGPCQITFEGRNAARLERGKLAARVEGEAARGFTIDTPFATVTDLGTEFGVAVCDEAAEVEVYQGEVRMEVTDSSGRNKAVRITAGGTGKADRAGNLTTGTGGAERLDIVRNIAKPGTIPAQDAASWNIEPHDGTPFVAYHDFGATDSRQASTGNITTHQLGSGQREWQDTSPKTLINYADGSPIGVLFRITKAGNGMDGRSNVTGPPAAGTPAHALFNVPGLNLDNGTLVAGNPAGGGGNTGTVEFTLSGLNPGYLYDLAFYGHRSATADGAEQFTLGGAVSAKNVSSTGIIRDTITRLDTRMNQSTGHVVRWTDIAPGEGGTVTVVVDPSVTSSRNLAYLSAMRLEAVGRPSVGARSTEGGE